mgnify:CR=1 FL=1
MDFWLVEPFSVIKSCDRSFFAEFSHHNLYKNCILQLGKNMPYDHEIFCAYRFHGKINILSVRSNTQRSFQYYKQLKCHDFGGPDFTWGMLFSYIYTIYWKLAWSIWRDWDAFWVFCIAYMLSLDSLKSLNSQTCLCKTNHGVSSNHPNWWRSSMDIIVSCFSLLVRGWKMKC